MAVRNLPEMPCGPILELHGQRKRFHIPYGLKPLVEEMAREVLKTQPIDINDFLATFMESRVRRKQEEEERKQARKSWQVHRWSWEGTSLLPHDELVEFLEVFHTQEKDADHYATVIQAAYRGHRSRDYVKEYRRSLTEERRASQQTEEEILRKMQEAAEEEEEDEEEEEEPGETGSGTELEEDEEQYFLFDEGSVEEESEMDEQASHPVSTGDDGGEGESIGDADPPELQEILPPPPPDSGGVGTEVEAEISETEMLESLEQENPSGNEQPTN